MLFDFNTIEIEIKSYYIRVWFGVVLKGSFFLEVICFLETGVMAEVSKK